MTYWIVFYFRTILAGMKEKTAAECALERTIQAVTLDTKPAVKIYSAMMLIDPQPPTTMSSAVSYPSSSACDKDVREKLYLMDMTHQQRTHHIRDKSRETGLTG